jgi:hypothetical protein
MIKIFTNFSVAIVLERNGKIKSRTFTALTFHPNLSSMPANDFSAQVQPDSKTRNMQGVAALHPEITIEYFFFIIGVKPIP